MRLALRGIALALLFGAAPAGAVTFTKIAGAPDTLYSYPAVDDGLVAFGAARFSTTEWGIYASSGGALTTIMDNSTQVPGRSETFCSAVPPSVSNGNVVFSGDGCNAEGNHTSTGIYASFGGGPLTEVVGVGPSEPPGTVYPETSYGDFAFDGTTVAFKGRVDDGPIAIYTSGPGGLEVVADSTTLLPNGNTPRFTDYRLSIDSSGVAFLAHDYDDFPDGYHEGIYVASAGTAPRVVVEQGMLAPEKGEPFLNLRVLDSHDGNILFGGTTLVSPTQGSPFSFYAEIGGVLTWIADAPAGQNLGLASIHGDRIAWQTGVSCPFAWCPGAIHVYVDGQRATVIESGDVLDGRMVNAFTITTDAISGDQLAFAAYFTDGTSGVFVADLNTIPEPDTTLQLAAGVVALGVLARRRSAR
jgi:hypothetical protein